MKGEIEYLAFKEVKDDRRESYTGPQGSQKEAALARGEACAVLVFS